MTLANNYAPIKQAADGSTVAFSGGWQMIVAASARVYLENTTTGVQTLINQGVASNQYQIALSSSGFVVTFNTAPAIGNNVIIARQTTPDQTDPYSTARGFQGGVEEDSFDKLTALLQENNYSNNRAISFPLGDTSNPVLPIPALRANTLLGFDGSGNVILSAGSSGGTVISAPMKPVVQAASLAAALALLGGAPLASPALTGTPTAPTASPGTNTTQLATTAFVAASISAPQSWTPALKFGGAAVGVTYGTQSGSYVQIGKLVFVEWLITLTSKGSSSGAATLTGLPVAAAGSTTGPGFATAFQNMSSISNPFAFGVSGNLVTLSVSDGSTGQTNLTDTNFTNTTIFDGSAIYIAA